MKTAVVTEPDAALSPAAQAYQAIGLAAVVMLGAGLFQLGADRWALVPVLIGAAGLAFRWRTAPLACLTAVAFAVVASAWTGAGFAFRRVPSEITNLGLGLAVVAYTLAQYRLLGLTVAVLPPDPLRPKDKPPPRPAEAAPPREAALAVMVAAGAALAGVFVWEVTDIVPPPWGILRESWRVGLVVWVMTALLVGLFSVLGYLGWRRQSRDEAALVLQDTLWAETRREQRRIQRWAAWARARRKCRMTNAPPMTKE
jgi:hypothetical protein